MMNLVFEVSKDTREFIGDSFSPSGLWTSDPVPQPCWTPIYEGGELNEETGEVTGGTWIDPGAPVPPTAEEVAADAFANNQKHLTEVIQHALDDFAKTGGYDSILSLCTYATSSVPKFQIEGQYGVELRDQCWTTGYAVLAEIAAGDRDWPTDEDALAMMPEMAWPDA